MGNTTSKKKIFDCPENYDQAKFNKIVEIFRKMDPESNDFIKATKMDNEVLKELAFGEFIMDLDRLENLKKEKEEKHKEILNEIQRNAEDMLIASMKKEFQRHRDELVEIEKEKNILVESSDEKKLEKLKEKIPNSNKGIYFWDFFKYMKERISNFDFLF